MEMTKQKRKQETIEPKSSTVEESKVVQEVGFQSVADKQPEDRVRLRFVPKDCEQCKALRIAKNETRSFSRVYATVGGARYCKCYFCGHTWKVSKS
jgi:hypothetical protein